SPLRRAPQCVLQIARSPIPVRRLLAQLLEPPCTDPYARWCGRGGAARLPPIPILEPIRKQRVHRSTLFDCGGRSGPTVAVSFVRLFDQLVGASPPQLM